MVISNKKGAYLGKISKNKVEMRLSNNIIESVVQEVVGEDAIPLIRFLKNNKNISEFKIAEVIKKEVNATRNILYRLYENNLVSFMRKKDKKKGWYIYYWTLKDDQIKKLKIEIDIKKIKQLKKRIKREKENIFFVCENNCIRLNFDRSTDFEFKCPECGSLMHQQDNEKIKKELNKKIEKLNKSMNK